jgi:hypothetical protein
MSDYQIISGLKAPAQREPRRSSLPRMIDLATRMKVGEAVPLSLSEATQLRIVLLVMGFECVYDAKQSPDKTKLLVFKLERVVSSSP